MDNNNSHETQIVILILYSGYDNLTKNRRKHHCELKNKHKSLAGP